MLKIDFDLTEFTDLEIIPLADIHIGNELCDIGALKNIIEYINDEPANPSTARICLLNGDLTESVTRRSVGSIFEQQMSPQVQVATITQMLKPLSEKRPRYPQGKILSYCGGNHDVDRYKDTGITSAQTIAVNLGLEERYSNDGCYSFIKLQRLGDKGCISYTCYNQHMTGSAGTVGGKANRVGKISNGIFADLIVGSHFHLPLTFKENMILPYEQKSALTQRTITYVITNAFLKFGDYAQKMGMKPNTITVPKIYIRQMRNGEGRSRYFTTEVLI